MAGPIDCRISPTAVNVLATTKPIDYALPKGELMFKGRRINPAAIRRTALLTVEGDDICAIGQTLAAQDLACSVRPYLRTHYVQPNVGHYGVCSGKRWQKHIYPVVRNVVHTSQ